MHYTYYQLLHLNRENYLKHDLMIFSTTSDQLLTSIWSYHLYEWVREREIMNHSLSRNWTALSINIKFWKHSPLSLHQYSQLGHMLQIPLPYSTNSINSMWGLIGIINEKNSFFSFNFPNPNNHFYYLFTLRGWFYYLNCWFSIRILSFSIYVKICLFHLSLIIEKLWCKFLSKLYYWETIIL